MTAAQQRPSLDPDGRLQKWWKIADSDRKSQNISGIERAHRLNSLGGSSELSRSATMPESAEPLARMSG